MLFIKYVKKRSENYVFSEIIIKFAPKKYNYEKM